RKANQEHSVLDRKEGREDQLREQQAVFDAATAFAAECSDVLTNAVDTKAVFNAIRDALIGAAGKPDPNAGAKLDEAAKQAEATKRITTPLHKLKMVGESPRRVGRLHFLRKDEVCEFEEVPAGVA